MKAGLITPLYLSTSWVLTVSYQLFTDTAVKAIATSVNSVWPAANSWLIMNMETIVFIYAFTWIFVLSSVLPSVILGKERGILIQYAVVLTLTLLAFFMKDILLALSGFDLSAFLNNANVLNNPALAIVYLIIPYLVMIGLDVHSRTVKKRAALQKAANEEWNKRKTFNESSSVENAEATNDFQKQESLGEEEQAENQEQSEDTAEN